MKARIFLLLLTASALLLASCTPPPRERSMMEPLDIGRTAPSFKLPDLDGRETSLDQYRGKVVMLDFWATWCGPCRMTMPVMEKLQKEYASDMVVLAINLQETEEMVRQYAREQNINTKILLDREGAVGEIYGTASIPMHVLIDRSGTIRHIQMGYSPGMESKLRSEIQSLR